MLFNKEIVFSMQKREINRYFTSEEVHPFAEVEWEKRDAVITGLQGVVFEQKDVETPVEWSALATKIVASKYFRGQQGTESREKSVRQVLSRVANTIRNWGRKDG